MYIVVYLLLLLMSTTAATSATVANDDNTVSLCYPVNSENYCFYTNGSVLSWNEAREFCARRNSTLPIITDEDVDSVFQQFIVNDAYSVIQNTSVWIDAHARQVLSNGPWHWIDGRPSGYLAVYSIYRHTLWETVGGLLTFIFFPANVSRHELFSTFSSKPSPIQKKTPATPMVLSVFAIEGEFLFLLCNKATHLS